MDRIEKLCSFLDGCKIFADVGCDHGYCTLYMLKNGLCERAVISDISAQCLQKAEKLLAGYIKNGVCRSVCCNGLPDDAQADEVLIAGMGGQEIVEILSKADLPAKFVLQPMKNAPELRNFLLSRSAHITEDCVFKSGDKFYTVIKGCAKGAPSEYTETEIQFGKSRRADDIGYLTCELEKKKGYLDGCASENARQNILNQIKKIEGVIKGELR